MREDPELLSRTIIGRLASQANLSDGNRLCWFGIIRQAVVDLINPYDMTSVDYDPETYFQTQWFRDHAAVCDLDPEWILSVLDQYGVLRDGRRIYENTQFFAA